MEKERGMGNGDWKSCGYEIYAPPTSKRLTCKFCGMKSIGFSVFKNVVTGEFIHACTKCTREHEELQSCFNNKED